MDAAEPWNWALPNGKTPPLLAANQYPPPLGVAAIPTIGTFQPTPDPWKVAFPNEKTFPVDDTSQYPSALGAEAIPTMDVPPGTPS
jgi:hypothetical protein